VAVIEFSDVEGRRWRREAEKLPVLLHDDANRLRRLQLGRLGVDWRTRRS
jgi:hypothetical protein